MNENKLVEVCDKCFRATCWYGQFMCDESYGAGTILKTVKELRDMDTHEHESYWSDEYMEKVYGESNPFGFRE